ncbi:hypothetical protein [Breoghania sp.]|uniref:hypothetical protein n=1 Tax=Breoghania sp. TaxID=2065378 RepID=UPI002632B875|nr:hypothetical protein [Breoghania sp.]MDJ0929800.1 hypothetical protein [Breoghania sp.]
MQASNLRRADLTIASTDLDATITDPLATPRIEGTISARDIRQGGITVTDLSGKASHDGDVTNFSATANMDDGKLSLDGSIKPEGDGFAITLSKAGGSWKGIETKLTKAAQIVVENGQASISDEDLALGGGSASISGTAGSNLDVSVNLNAVPMSLANAVAPGFGIEGTFSGTAHATGADSNPEAT